MLAQNIGTTRDVIPDLSHSVDSAPVCAPVRVEKKCQHILLVAIVIITHRVLVHHGYVFCHSSVFWIISTIGRRFFFLLQHKILSRKIWQRFSSHSLIECPWRAHVL